MLTVCLNIDVYKRQVGLLGYALGHKTDGGDDTEYETIDDSDNSVDYETNSEEQNKIVRKGEYL